jgi:outer membrane protein OmpA-like peptidoglycan-associated protein
MRLAKPAPLAFVLTVGVVASAGAADLHGEGRGGGSSFGLGAFAGGHVFAEGTNLGILGGTQNPDGAESGVLGGLRASLGLGRWFVAEAELAGLGTRDRLYQRNARALGYRVSALVPLMAGDFRPFVLVGAGAMQVVSTDAEGSAGLSRDTKAEVHTGIGFDYRVLGPVSVRGDARVVQVPSKESWGLSTDVEAMLGATVSFGGRRPSSETRGDSAALPAAALSDEPPPVEPTMAPKGQVVASAEPGMSPREEPRSEASAGPAAGSLEVAAAAPGASPLSDLLERAREIRFEAGTVTLTQASLAFLAEVAAALAREPAVTVEIFVHTAAHGDAAKAMALSQRRAEAIKGALVDDGARAEQLIAIGRGVEDPIAPNLTRTGRQRNERVELHRAHVPGRGP